jgi:oligoribonuclease NrnB/cAMP/cGMP phosphodiesterase (DHH superfamily)
MTIICYHHDDLDGIVAGAIVLEAERNVEFIAVNYGDMWDEELVKDAKVYVVDFSFPVMMKLKESCKELVWIDHHKTAMEQQIDAWNDEEIKGLRSMELSGCELTWQYFHNGENVPQVVKYVGDMDLWEFDYGNDTKQYCEAAKYIFTTPDDYLLGFMLTTGQLNFEKATEIKEQGKILIKAKEERVKKVFHKGIDISLQGYRARLMNTTCDTSEVGAYVYTMPEYDMAVMYQIIGNDVILSFRSNVVDVGEIAESYGGGGHKFASGATVDFEILIGWYNTCKKNI